MSLTDVQFDRIMHNWIKHKTPLSTGKHHKMLQYTINNYDELPFTRGCQSYYNHYNYLKKEAVDKLGDLYIQFDGNKWTYKGTILELYVKLRGLRHNPHNIGRIIIDDKRCRWRGLSKYNKEIYFVINQCENITFYDRWECYIDTISDLLPYMINKNIAHMGVANGELTFSKVNYHKTHYQIGRTIYYKAYVLHRLFLVKQLTISDITYLIGSYLIKLLDEL